MQTILIVASLWATADPVPDARQPIGPWLTGQTQLAVQHIHDARTRLDLWVEKTLDVEFDIQGLSLTDDAAKEIRFVAQLDEETKGSIVIPREKAEAVQSIAAHIVAAGDARIAAEHTIVTRAGTPGTATTYVNVGLTLIDDKGVARAGFTKEPDGDAFRVHPTDVTLSSTTFLITVYSDRLPDSRVATSEFTTKPNLNLGESLLIYRRGVSPAELEANRTVPARPVVIPEQPAPATLIIVTPRRVIRARESTPRSL